VCSDSAHTKPGKPSSQLLSRAIAMPLNCTCLSNVFQTSFNVVYLSLNVLSPHSGGHPLLGYSPNRGSHFDGIGITDISRCLIGSSTPGDVLRKKSNAMLAKAPMRTHRTSSLTSS
jgi:hypothetical protein